MSSLKKNQTSSLAKNLTSHTSHHHYLLLKQIKEQQDVSELSIGKYIKESGINFMKVKTMDEKCALYTKIVRHIGGSEVGKRYISEIQDKIVEKMSDMHESHTRQTLYAIQSLREANSYPFVQEDPLKQASPLNFTMFHRKYLTKQLRRMIWNKLLVVESSKITFIAVDRSIIAYNVQQENMLVLEKLVRDYNDQIKQATKQFKQTTTKQQIQQTTTKQQKQIQLKESQKDIALRLLQYVLKSSHYKIAIRAINHLILLLLEIYSFYTLSKINEIGSALVSLIDLNHYYYESTIENRYKNILLALQLLDQENYMFVHRQYIVNGEEYIQTAQKNISMPHSMLNNKQKKKDMLNQCFENFRISLGSMFLSLEVTSFVIDQLLIRKRCKFDIYIFFAIVLMILSDQIYIDDVKQKEIDAYERQVDSQQKRYQSVQMKHPNEERKLKTQTQNKERKSYSLKLILQRARYITISDMKQAYEVIYEKIPSYYTYDDLQELSNSFHGNQDNKLLKYIMELENPHQQAIYHDVDSDQENTDGFIIENKIKNITIAHQSKS